MHHHHRQSRASRRGRERRIVDRSRERRCSYGILMEYVIYLFTFVVRPVYGCHGRQQPGWLTLLARQLLYTRSPCRRNSRCQRRATPAINPFARTGTVQLCCKGSQCAAVGVGYRCLALHPTEGSSPSDQCRAAPDFTNTIYQVKDLLPQSSCQCGRTIQGEQPLKDAGSSIYVHVLAYSQLLNRKDVPRFV